MNSLVRYIRHCNAPAYLGMCKEVFERDARPYLIEIPIGRKGIAFDRVDLDAFADEYKRRNGRPARKEFSWDERERGEFPSKKTDQEPSIRSGAGKESSPDLGGYRSKKPKTGLQEKSAGVKQSSKVEAVVDRCLQIAQRGT